VADEESFLDHGLAFITSGGKLIFCAGFRDEILRSRLWFNQHIGKYSLLRAVKLLLFAPSE
jgi:hypothetical protein